MNSKEQKELRGKVHQTLQSYYKSKGFKLNKKFGLFSKGEYEVFWGISSKYSDEIIFRPSLSVSNEEIKRLLTKAIPNQLFSLVTSRKTSSLLAQEFGIRDYDYLISKDGMHQECTYIVTTETDLLKIADDHRNFMEKVGFPFFEKISTLEGIDDYINGRVLEGDKEYFQSLERQKEIKKFFDKQEVLSGIVAAHLVNNPQLHELIERYKLMFEGNNYILDDVNIVLEYFIEEVKFLTKQSLRPGLEDSNKCKAFTK